MGCSNVNNNGYSSVLPAQPVHHSRQKGNLQCRRETGAVVDVVDGDSRVDLTWFAAVGVCIA